MVFARPRMNTEGTLNYQPRLHKFHILFNPIVTGSSNVQLFYNSSVLLTDPTGNPLSGIDCDSNGPYLSIQGFPVLPAGTYTGDGFGGNGTGGRRVCIDPEGLILNSDGSFWISDEYGPYFYRFSSTGRILTVVRPPDPYIPKRNGSDSFSANSAPRYYPDRTVTPVSGPSGRQNNQGFEGLTKSPDGKRLYVLSQSALNQDGGVPGGRFRRYARMLVYNNTVTPPTPVAEFVVPLPIYTSITNATAVAAQSEIHYVSDTQFLILPRDSGSGHGLTYSESRYRHVDVFDISNATNILGRSTIAPNNGTLNSTITAATFCPWIDFNLNTQLNRYGLHNGGAQDQYLLNEKWESLVLVPVLDKKQRSLHEEYYVLSLSDNDFVTQDGYIKNGTVKYADKSGYNLDNQVLVFHVKLPKRSRPLIG